MNELVLAFLKLASGTAISLMLSAIALKVISVAAGPAGLGYFALLRQIYLVALPFATLGTSTALVQALATSRPDRRIQVVVSTLWIVCLLTALTGGILILGAPYLATFMFGTTRSSVVRDIRWLCVPLALGAVFVFGVALLNAVSSYGRVAMAQALSAGAMALMAYPFVTLAQQGYSLGWVALLGGPLLVGAIAVLVMLSRSQGVSRVRSALSQRPDTADASNFARFGATFVAVGTISLAVQCALRALVARELGLGKVGLFDSAWTLSQVYVLLLLTTLQSHYLPGLARSAAPDRQRMIERVLRLSIMVIVPLVVAMIVLKPLLMPVLYSKAFLPAIPVLGWLLVSDYLRITSWVLAAVMLASNDMRAFFWSEAVANSLLLAGSWVWLQRWHSLSGIGLALVATYALYFMFAVYYAVMDSTTRLRIHRSDSIRWIAGLALVVGASYCTWGEQFLDWRDVILWLLAASGLAVSAISGSEKAWVAARLRRALTN